jgi:hypothetical protein
VKNELWRRARAVPSLDLRFADNKSLVDATTGAQLVTFTRASSGTFVGSDGLIKTAVTNLLLRSEEFDNASWSKTASSVTANAIVAPNGTVTADKLVEDTSTGGHVLVQSFSGIPDSASVCVSCYCKAAERSWVAITVTDKAAIINRRWFNLSDGTQGATNGTISAFSATNVGDGWYRIAVTASVGTGANTPGVRISLGAADNTASYTGDGTSGIFIWGAQLEQSSTVGEYIPTTSTINSAPRFDHNPTTGESLGLLVEEQRTNSIRNNTMVGAVAGTPGTLPTNWASTTPANGITREIVGVGVEDGIQYIDLRFSGTNTLGSAFYMDITFDSGAITAAQGQSWTESIYVRLMAGTVSGAAFTALPGLVLYSTPNFDDNAALRPISVTNAKLSSQRFAVTRTLANATSTGVSPRFSWTIATGGTIDFTLRIGLPQLEQGAFATSVIPTSTATVTRSADVASISGSNFSSWYRQNEGTVFANALVYNSGIAAPLAAFDDGTLSNRINLNHTGTTASRLIVVSSSSIDVNMNTAVGSYPIGVANTAVAAFAANNFALLNKGSDLVVDTLGAMPVNVDRVGIGFGSSVARSTCVINRLTYWPTRLPNSTLQAVTQ